MIWIGYYPTRTNHLATRERNPRGRKPWQIRTLCGRWLDGGDCELGVGWARTCKRCLALEVRR